MSFFFTKPRIKPTKRAAPAQAGKASKDTLNRLGCKACPLDKTDNCTPKMPPDLGELPANIYFLGDTPSEADDSKGYPFSDKAGKLLRAILGNDATDACFDNTVRDFDELKKQPSWVAMECCRPLVTKSIEQAKPRLIVGLGILPLQLMLNSSDMVGLRGRVFAVKVGNHACWFLPTYHPQYVIDKAYEGQEPLRSKLGQCLKFDIARALSLADSLPKAAIDTPQGARAGVQAFNGSSRAQLAQVLKLISSARNAPEKAIDLETSHLRSYASGAKVLTVALSYGETNFAFAMDHPKAGWLPDERKALKHALSDLLSDQTKIIAHNCFSGDTEVLTDKGVFALKELTNTPTNVWTEAGWWPATIMKFGKQPVTELEFVPYNRSRSSIKHTIKTTEQHNWVVERKCWIGKKYQWARVEGFVKTSALKVGDKMVATAPNIRKPDTYSEGFIHGLIFADGALIKARVKSESFPHNIRLCGWKAMFADRFKKVTYPASTNGDPVCNWYVSSNNLKELPIEGSSPEYIQDFIEGWQLLDGANGSKKHQTRIVSTTNEKAALWLQRHAALAGWFVTGHVKDALNTNWSSENTPFCWEVTITKHDDMAWTLRSKVQTGHSEEVYCARVPEIKCFTLGPGIYTGNCPFEVEWLIHLLGREVIFHDTWECTMMQAHFLDERRGKRGGNDDQFQPNPYQALDFLVKQYFGISFKALFKINRKKMADADLDETLLYNGADTKYTLRLHKLHVASLKQRGLLAAYRESKTRQPTVALMQALGIDVDQAQNKALRKKLGKEIIETEGRINATPEVIRFIADRRSFNPASQPDVLRIFKDYIKAGKLLTNAAGKDSVNKASLSGIDHPLAKDIEDFRNRTKLKSTYVDILEYGKGELIFPDGKIHPTFNTTFAETGRTSCDSPNVQNFPKRHDAWIRKQIIAPKGHVLVAFDYGQLEGCTGAMCSKDKVFVKALWEDYDMHLEWAQRTAMLWPAYIGGKENLSDKAIMKEFRSLIKNKLVFPAFFGAAKESIAGYLTFATGVEAPPHVIDKLFNEFWAAFSGTYRWQKRLMAGYYENGYVESLTGRRRHYPLGRPQAINYPVQSVACDIVCHAMVTLSERAADKAEWHLHPIMNIHDDLTMCIPDQPKLLEEAIETIYRVMLADVFDFVNVPMSVTCSIGNNWLEMTEIGKFWSHKDL